MPAIGARFPDGFRQRFLLAGGLLVVAGALAILAAWGLGVYPPAGAVKFTKPASAAMFLLLGAALATCGWPPLAAGHRLRAALAVCVLAVAAYAAGGLLGFYALAAQPGVHAAVLVATGGLGLLLLSAGVRGQPGEWLGVAMIVHGMLIHFAHLFDVDSYSLLFGDGGTAIPTAILGLTSGALLVAAHGDGLLVNLIGDDGIAGALMRRLVPILFVSVPLLGWLRFTGEYAGWYGDHEGLVYMVGSATLVALATAVYGASVVRRLERAARKQTQLFEKVVEGTEDAVFVKDRSGRYLLANRVALRNIALPREQLLGRRDDEVMAAADAEALRVSDRRVIESGENLVVEESLDFPGGRRTFIATKIPLRSARGEIEGLICVARDITEQKRHQAELEYHSTHDQLTGLANRSLLRDRLAQALALAERHGHLAAVVVLDLDAFKRVNEDLSYEAGDQLLRRLALRIAGCLRRGDTVARVYGDEFVAVLGEVTTRDYVDEVVRRILQAISEPWQYEGHEVVLGASAGISLYPSDAQTADELEKHAEMAMHRAKELGKNRHEFFRSTTARDEGRRLDRERELRHALESGELVLHYQPKIELESGFIAGAEALIRWQHPQRGLLGPDQFIPLAEDSGLIVPISEWVIAEGCAAIGRWRAAGLDTGPIALNLSGRQLQDAELARRLQRIVADSGIPPGALELEVTETSVLRDQEETARILHGFHEMGIRLALDDFGTGYSSLSFLRKFPISCLKIDRSFVRDIHSDPGDAAIARTVIAMAHALKLYAVAEGVETAAQLRYLRHYRCDQMQGFLFSRALPGNEFAERVAGGAGLDFTALGIAVQRCLLLVDDEEGVVSALRRLFRRDGYRILSAASGEEALALLAGNEVQVIISDQRMGGISGTELLARVADLYPETIRIMLTGYTDLQSVINSVNRGAIWKFLTKPWEDASLREQVRDAFLQYEAKYGR